MNVKAGVVLVLVGMAGLMAACGAGPTPGFLMAGSPPYPPPEMTHRVASSHVEIYWTCGRPSADLLRVEGVARSPWYQQPVRYLEIEVAGMDAQDRTVSSGVGAATNHLLGTNQITRFQLEVRPAGSERRFDLWYQYDFDDVEFEASLLAASVPGPIRLARNQRFLVRDACNETQHKAR